MRSTPWVLAGGFLLLCTGPACLEEKICEDLQTRTPVLQLGTGATEFIPLQDGDFLEVNQGPQNGFHVYGSMQVGGIHPGVAGTEVDDDRNPVTEYKLDLADGTSLAVKERPGPLDGNAELATRFGEPVILHTNWDETIAVEGQEGVFSLTVTDQCGDTVTEEVDVMLTIKYIGE
jgi:hypothetical protein